MDRQPGSVTSTRQVEATNRLSRRVRDNVELRGALRLIGPINHRLGSVMSNARVSSLTTYVHETLCQVWSPLLAHAAMLIPG